MFNMFITEGVAYIYLAPNCFWVQSSQDPNTENMSMGNSCTFFLQKKGKKGFVHMSVRCMANGWNVCLCM